MRLLLNLRTLARLLGIAFLTVLLTACPFDRQIEDEVFYFLLADRFNNADPGNDTGGIPGGPSEHGHDPTHKSFYHGGDLKGLQAKLKYLQKMGITAIWMAPMFKNQPVQGDPPNQSAAYHGYWITDFTQIDPHFGTNQELRDLIESAHKRGMKVFFDIISNHTADVIRYQQCHNPDGSFIGDNTCPYRSLEASETNPYTPFVPAYLEGIKVPTWLNDSQYYHNQGDSTFSGENSLNGDFVGLDDLKTEDPVVVQGMIDIYKFWIREFKIDGFRIDTVKHVNIEFWQAWSPAIIDYAHEQGIPDFHMFGEVFDANPVFLSRYTTEGKLPSVLDFAIQGTVRAVFSTNQATDNLRNLFANDDYYNDADSDAYRLMNFAGNHDMGRIGYFINIDNPDATQEEKLKRAKLAHAFMFFARGIPVVYYGDEQGFTGDGGDRDAREDMFPSQVDSYNDNDLLGTDATTAEDNFDTHNPMYRAIRGYAKTYFKHEALRRGKQFHRYSEGGPGIYAFSRVMPDVRREYLVVFNSATDEKTATMAATSDRYRQVYPHGGKLHAQSGEVGVTLPPLSFAIYKAKRSIPELNAAPGIVITSPGASDAVFGKVEIDAALDDVDLPVPLLKVAFEVKIGDGEFEYIGEDWSVPYRIFWDSRDVPNKTPVIIRATVDDLFGHANSTELQLVVDDRVPQQLILQYENGNARDSLLTISDGGLIGGPYTLTDGIAQLAWDENDNSLTLIYEQKDGVLFDFDRPVRLRRSQVVALSDQDTDGDLIAELYINNAGEIAKVDNHIGGAAAALPRDNSAPAPFDATTLYLRGSLSDWGATDAMSYLGNHSYHFQRVVKAGDIEYKFADADWAAVNYGTPFGESGLTSGGASGNIPYHIPQKELYDFHFFQYPLADGSFSFHRLEPVVGSFGMPMYVRGRFNGWGTDDKLAYQGSDSFKASVEISAAGTYAFKVADADWSAGTSFGAGADPGVALDTGVALVEGSNTNISLVIDVAGTYLFALDTTNKTNPSLTVQADE